MEYETNDNDDTDESLPTKEEIRKALSLANPQYQAIIYLMSSSGITGVDIRNITINDYLESLEIKINDSFDVDEIFDKLKEKEISNAIPVWRIQRKKNNNKQFTFSTPESVKAINIHFRQKIENNDFPSLDDYLFKTIIYENGKLKSIQIKDHTLSTYFKRLNDRCKFDKKIGENKNIGIFSSHNLRRWFRSTIYNEGDIDSDTAERLLGHKLPKTKASYAKLSIDKHKKEYIKVLSALTMNEMVNLELMENVEEITKLKAELDNIKSKLAGLGPLAEVMDKPKVKKVVEEELKS